MKKKREFTEEQKEKQRQKRKELRDFRRASGLCTDCGKESMDVGARHCIKCNERVTKQQKKYYIERKTNGICRRCGNGVVDGKAYCVRCSKSSVSSRSRLRSKIIEKYGSKCECCNESNPRFLTIDHVNNDGITERMKSCGKSMSFLRKLARTEKRPDLRLLCYNCNMGRQHNGGICPHKDIDENEKQES